MQTYRNFFLSFVVLVYLTGCATSVSRDIPQQVAVPVFFVTDRDINSRGELPASFGNDRGEVSRGVTTVALRTRRPASAGLADPARWQAYPGNGGGDAVVDIELLSEAEFYTDLLGTQQPGNSGSTLLLYIHGYNRDYTDAVLDTADFMYEVNPQYPLVLYSWPSAGSVLAYASDQVNMDWSTYHLSNFLLDLLGNEAVSRIHILAHSLGNRGLLNALKYLSDSGKLPASNKIGQVVLFAPDVDTEIFARDYLPVLSAHAEGVSLYANEKDVPLQTSNRLNRYERLGSAEAGIFTAAGLDSIDMSGVVSIFNSHDAHLEIPEVQEDLHYLLNLQLPADQRPTLLQVGGEPDGTYWEISGQ